MSQGLAVEQGAAPVSLLPEPSVLELEDMLYDILASGADPSLPDGTLEAVQTFLHEHARSKHTLAEFLAFFAKHGLSTVKETTLTLALPPILEARSGGTSVPFPQPNPAQPEPEPIEVAPVAVEKPRSPRTLAWVCGIAALAAISGGGWFGFTTTRAELDRMREEQRATQRELARVQAEAASLRQSVEQNDSLVRRVDRKSELLLQTLVSPLDPNQR